MDCSLPGSSIHGIFKAIVLEWVAISFFRRSFQPSAAPWTVAQQASPRNSSGNNTGEGTHSLSPWDVPDPGMEPGSPAWQADSLPSESQGKHII